MKIEKLNEVFYRITNCNISSLETYFKIKDDQCYFKPSFKMGMWDGFIRYFDYKFQTLPIGLTPQLQSYIKDNNIQCDYNFNDYNNFSVDDIKNFIICNNLDVVRNPYPFQLKSIQRALNYKRGVIKSPTGCHSKGTKVLMFDGTFKNVEDVKIGDKLMGIDSTPRNVLRLYSGNELMYKIKPNNGEEFIVNENHVLHLHRHVGYGKNNIKIENVSVKDYLNKSKTFKHCAKLKYNIESLEFETSSKNDLVISPYFLGYYLGDGHTYDCAITTHINDYDNIMLEIKKQLNILNMSVDDIREITPKPNVKTMFLNGNLKIRKSNQLLTEFNKIGLHFNRMDNRTKCELKFIPDIYKYSSTKNRLELLAGIIDSDGYLHDSKSYFDITLKSKQLIDDIIFVASSLGFKCRYSLKHVKQFNKDYYRCLICGDIAKIPTRLERKKTNFVRVGQDPSRCGFEIESVGSGDFYGFELDGDHLYYINDFLITHNSGKSLNIYMICKYLLSIKKSILIITPQVDLVNQLYNDFISYGWNDCKDYVNTLHGNVKKFQNDKPVLISTFQSLLILKDEFFQNFDAVLVDEVHTAKAVSIRDILINCINAEYRIGLTATMPEKDVDKFTIYSYLGRLVFDIPIKTLQDEGFLTPLIVNIITLKYPRELISNCKIEFDKEYNFISKVPKRNNLLRLIFNKIDKTENILILCKNVSQVKMVYDDLQQNCKDYNVYKILGEVKSEDRDDIILKVENNGSSIIVATYGTMSTGRNVKRLHHVILFSPYKSQIKVLQSIGRGTRLHETKKLLQIWDIVDDLSYYDEFDNEPKHKKKLKENHLLQHSKLRLQYYKQNEFPISCEVVNYNEL